MIREEIAFKTSSPEETHRVGERLSHLLKKNDVIALYGELGSGKTVFTQGVCVGLQIKSYITSPTFTLVQEYPGIHPVYHFDFYRLDSIEEIDALDLDGYFMADGICIIEWAERGEALLPEDRIEVRIERLKRSDTENIDKRDIMITAPQNRRIKEVVQ